MKARDIEFTICSSVEIYEFIENNHYSHNLNGVKISLAFKATYNNELLGAMILGQLSTTAWKKFGTSEYEVLELRRLVFLDKAPKNSESRFIGYVIRYIKKNLKYIKIIVTYADPNHGHSGVIYRATNFKYIGKSSKDYAYKDIENDKIYHSRALRTKYKGEYKPFVKRLRDKLNKGLLTKIELQGKHCFIYEI